MNLLKQSTAATIVLGPFVDSTDGVTAETGLTIAQADVRLSKNGGAFAQKNDANSATHMENGYYSCALDATDTGTLGRLKVAVNESGALPVWHEFMVLPANAYDALVLGTDTLQVDVTQWMGAAVTEPLEDAAAIADAVWDEALAGHATAGSAGAALSAAGSAGDPWSTALPGAYASGTAGNIIGNNLDATVSSRLASSSYTAPLDAAGTRTALGLASANLDTQLADLPTVAEFNARTLASADYATAALQSTIAGYLDTEVAAILAAVDTEIGTLTTNLATVDTVVDAIQAKTDQLTFTKANELDANVQSINGVTITGNGQVGTEFGV